MSYSENIKKMRERHSQGLSLAEELFKELEDGIYKCMLSDVKYTQIPKKNTATGEIIIDKNTESPLLYRIIELDFTTVEGKRHIYVKKFIEGCKYPWQESENLEYILNFILNFGYNLPESNDPDELIEILKMLIGQHVNVEKVTVEYTNKEGEEKTYINYNLFKPNDEENNSQFIDMPDVLEDELPF